MINYFDIVILLFIIFLLSWCLNAWLITIGLQCVKEHNKIILNQFDGIRNNASAIFVSLLWKNATFE